MWVGEGYSQRKFSQQNLSQLSSEELDLYLQDAYKQEKNGSTLAIIGGISAASGLGVQISAHFNVTENRLYLSRNLIRAGIVVGATGLIMNTVGSNHAHKIRVVQISRGLTIEISPALLDTGEAFEMNKGISVVFRF